MTLSCCYQPTLEIRESSNGIIQFKLLPELVLAGREDGAQIKLAVGDKKNAEVKLNVWREGDTVRCEDSIYKEGYNASAYIQSDTKEVVMEMPLPCLGPLTLTANGPAKKWAHCRGVYSLASMEHRGRPVYINRRGRYLYSLEDGRWVAAAADYQQLTNIRPDMRSTSPAHSPDLCQHWQYLDNGKYYQGDISVKYGPRLSKSFSI